MIDLLLPSSIGLLCIKYPGSLQSRYSKFLISSCKMKGLALAIAIGLACIWSNSNGMHVNVKVGINQSDDPDLKAGSKNAMCIDATCTKSGKKCLSIPFLPDTLPQTTMEEIKANHLLDHKFGEEEYHALKSNITLLSNMGCRSGIPDVTCVCVDIKTANEIEAKRSSTSHASRGHPCANTCTPDQWADPWWKIYCAMKCLLG